MWVCTRRGVFHTSAMKQRGENRSEKERGNTETEAEAMPPSRYRLISLPPPLPFPPPHSPPALNALCDELMWELNDVIEDFEKDNSVRSVVLTGGGRSFAGPCPSG